MRTIIIELALTDSCNLGCKYCYSHHSTHYMESLDVQKFEEAIGPIMEYYNCSKYHISYFGGEPLLNWKIIESSLPEFKASPKCSSIVVISNGLALSQKKVDFLKRYNCGLSWSFDGLWSSNRPLANGSSSFEAYEAIIPLALQLTTSCKVMVSPNSKDFVKNLEYFESIGIKHPDFSLVRDNIWTQGSIARFKDEMRDLTDYIIKRSFSSEIITTGLHTLYILDTFAGSKFGKRNHGCFVGSNGITYTYDNKIYPCERFRSNDKFCLYDSKEYNYNALKNLKDMSNPSDFEKCQKCELYKYCNAGCTYSQFDNNFEKQEPLDCVCELLKICYVEALRAYRDGSKAYRDFIHFRFSNAS